MCYEFAWPPQNLVNRSKPLKLEEARARVKLRSCSSSWKCFGKTRNIRIFMFSGAIRISNVLPDHPFLQEMKAISLGFSDHGSPEEMAEQDRRWAEIQRQEEEAKRKQTASSRLH